MKVTREQLEAFRFTKGAKAKTTDETGGGNAALTQVQLDTEGRAVACDSAALVVIKRPVADSEAKEMKLAHIPSSVARGVVEACQRAGVPECEITNSKKGKPHDFEALILDAEEDGQRLAIEYQRDGTDFPKWPDLLHGDGVKPGAQIAIDSKLLSKVAKLRGKVGGQGPVVFSIFGPTDLVYAAWRDSNGHKVLVAMHPTRVEADQLEDALVVP